MDPARSSRGATIDAMKATSRYMRPASAMPPSSARGKTLLGFCVSPATFAAFSKPVMAKNAMAAPPRITNAVLPSLNSNG
ncbi:hypothetical protein BH24ACT12_BH24ACT12_13060 [soil metagenome]